MNWNNGFSATYYAYVLDRASWRELKRLQITGGSIKHDTDGLRESADVDCVGYREEKEQWIRIYLDARQNGATAHVPVFTGLASSPSREIDGVYETSTLQCYSVLKPAADVLLDRGYYVLRGSNGAEVVRSLLSVSPAPVVVTGSASTLQENIIAEDGETRLSLADKILAAINWRMSIDGDGTIRIGPRPLKATVVFDPLENDCIEPQISVERDWYECPNVFRATFGDLTAVARDDDPNSDLSTVTRGREIWAEESSAQIGSGESVAEYARRRLTELQSVALSASYDRRYRPDVAVGDLIRLHYPRQGLDGVFRVESQSIELGYGARTSEEVVQA